MIDQVNIFSSKVKLVTLFILLTYFEKMAWYGCYGKNSFLGFIISFVDVVPFLINLESGFGFFPKKRSLCSLHITFCFSLTLIRAGKACIFEMTDYACFSYPFQCLKFSLAITLDNARNKVNLTRGENFKLCISNNFFLA